MKHIIAAVSFGLVAAPAFAQSFDRSPTDPVMPAYSYDPTVPFYSRNEERRQVASAGITRSDAEISSEVRESAEDLDRTEDLAARHIERQEGYFDPSN
jgi:hypothetical protein